MVLVTLLEDLTFHLEVLEVLRHILEVNGENVAVQILYLLHSYEGEINLSLKNIVLGPSPGLENLAAAVLGLHRFIDDSGETDVLGCFTS
jgi:hypothetical protein